MCIASETTENQGQLHVCRRRLGPGTLSKTAEADLDCAFVENAHLLRSSLIVKSQKQKSIELVTRPKLPPGPHALGPFLALRGPGPTTPPGVGRVYPLTSPLSGGWGQFRGPQRSGWGPSGGRGPWKHTQQRHAPTPRPARGSQPASGNYLFVQKIEIITEP